MVTTVDVDNTDTGTDITVPFEKAKTLEDLIEYIKHQCNFNFQKDTWYSIRIWLTNDQLKKRELDVVIRIATPNDFIEIADRSYQILYHHSYSYSYSENSNGKIAFPVNTDPNVYRNLIDYVLSRLQTLTDEEIEQLCVSSNSNYVNVFPNYQQYVNSGMSLLKVSDEMLSEEEIKRMYNV